MLKFIVAPLCGLSLAGSVYMAGWGSKCLYESGEEPCCVPGAMSMSTGAAVAEVTGEDMKNTKCLVSGEPPMGPDIKVAYQGKVYHLCCSACVAPFNKEPEKYVKAFEADPAKFGVKQ